MKVFISLHFYFVLSVLLGGISLFLGGIFIEKMYLKPNLARGLYTDATVLDEKYVQKGLLLFSPFIVKDNFTGKGRVYLTDLNGNIVHKWDTKYNTMYSLIMPNGYLYTAQIIPANLSHAPGGGVTGLLQELDLKGNVIWEYKDAMLHHDFDVDLESNTVYAIKFTPVSKSFSEKIQGGMFTKHTNFWSDTLVQIDRKGKIIWSWELQKNLKPDDFILNPITPRDEWSHSNSVKFYKTNPINNKPALLLSARHLNTVFLIDRETGKVLWKSPKGVFNYQHDATLTDNGTILVFDNGTSRMQEKFSLWSRLVEVNLKDNKIVWQFKGGETGIEKMSFMSSIMSGAQRLPNGNTLGIDSLRGHIFEVTKEGKVVFSFINPYQSLDKTSPFGNNIIFKARKFPYSYFIDYKGIAK